MTESLGALQPHVQRPVGPAGRLPPSFEGRATPRHLFLLDHHWLSWLQQLALGAGDRRVEELPLLHAGAAQPELGTVADPPGHERDPERRSRRLQPVAPRSPTSACTPRRRSASDDPAAARSAVAGAPARPSAAAARSSSASSVDDTLLGRRRRRRSGRRRHAPVLEPVDGTAGRPLDESLDPPGQVGGFVADQFDPFEHRTDLSARQRRWQEEQRGLVRLHRRVAAQLVQPERSLAGPALVGRARHGRSE